jgi:hypothetical protein
MPRKTFIGASNPNLDPSLADEMGVQTAATQARDAAPTPPTMTQADFTQGRESLAQKRRRNQLTAQQLRELSSKMDREAGY